MQYQPLHGLIVLDATRMLPGAVLARLLADLGARILKIEDPAGGDPLRAMPPMVDGSGACFGVFYRGTESLAIDLRDPAGAAAVRKLAKHADVFLESFRPGTLERWDLGRARLRALNPALVTCSLSSYGSTGEWAGRVGHDLNFVAQSGLLSLMRDSRDLVTPAAVPATGEGLPRGQGAPAAVPATAEGLPRGRVAPASVPATDEGLPRIQAADVSSGLLACSAVLAALLARSRTGIGVDLDQPLALGPLPFTAWAAEDARLGGPSLTTLHLAGRSPCYRIYPCSDGRRVSLCALEPKFWLALTEALGMPDLAGDGLDTGEAGEAAARRLAEIFAARPAEHWLDLARERNLPLTPVHDLEGARQDPFYGAVGDHWLGTGGRPSTLPVPRLGEHNERVGAEFAFSH